MIDRNTAAVSVFQAGFELERDRRDVRRAALGAAGPPRHRSAATAESGYYIDIVRGRFARLSWTLRAVFGKCSFFVTQLFHADQQRLFALNLLRQHVNKYFRF